MEMNKTFKKIAAMAITFSVLAAMTACAPKEEGSNAPQLISGGTAATTAAKEGGDSKETAASQATADAYSINYKGVVITPGMETESAITALGKGYIYNKVMSCAFNGIDLRL